MSRKLDDICKHRLELICQEHSFVRHGQSFFRLYCQNVLQAVAFQYERCFEHYSLNIGLMSIHGEPNVAYFRSNSILPRYSVCCLNNQSTAVSMNVENGLTNFVVATPDEQLDILDQKGFDWLDGINNQKKLLEALCYLDKVAYRGVVWNDMRKLAPCLSLGDYQSANMVISSILNQHLGPDSFSAPPWSDQDYIQFSNTYPNRDSEFLRIYRWIREKDEQALKNYLAQNEDQNLRYGRFLLRKRGKKTVPKEISKTD